MYRFATTQLQKVWPDWILDLAMDFLQSRRDGYITLNTMVEATYNLVTLHRSGLPSCYASAILGAMARKIRDFSAQLGIKQGSQTGHALASVLVLMEQTGITHLSIWILKHISIGLQSEDFLRKSLFWTYCLPLLFAFIKSSGSGFGDTWKFLSSMWSGTTFLNKRRFIWIEKLVSSSFKPLPFSLAR